MHLHRIEKLVAGLNKYGFSHAVFVPGASFYYFSGLQLFHSERLTLLGVNNDGKIVLLLPILEAEGVTDATGYDQVLTYSDEEGPEQVLRRFADALGGAASFGKVAVERAEIRLLEVDALFRTGMTDLASGDHLVRELRLFKDATELAALQKAADIATAALERLLPALQIGMTEVEIAAELEHRMRRLGSVGTPFSTIVGSGPRGALPHGLPSDRRVQAGDLVVLDYGASYAGYAADITRTIAFGEINEKARHVYETVKRAQAAAVQSIQPGIRVEEVDQVARQVIADAGFGKNFTHRTGHGLGLDVHEFPSIVGGNRQLLVPGMVFTVEPGIYLPDEFGVRIEDDVAVTEQGVNVLTKFSRELTVVAK